MNIPIWSACADTWPMIPQPRRRRQSCCGKYLQRNEARPQVIYRTRFKRHIVAEFTPPARSGKKEKVIVLCDGMPSMPRKQTLMEFLAGKGYWVFYPRYRGAWESGGEFLARSPHLDILNVIDALETEICELAFGQRF